MRLARSVGYAAVAMAVLLAAPTSAAVYTTAEAVMSSAYPRARMERRVLTWSAADQQVLSRLAEARCESRLITAHLAWRGDSLLGAGYVEQRIVRTMPGVFLVIVAPDTSVARIEILAFHEPTDYRPPARWLGLFAHRRLDPELSLKRSIRNISGASLSARAVTESARLALAIHTHVLMPSLGRRPMGASR